MSGEPKFLKFHVSPGSTKDGIVKDPITLTNPLLGRAKASLANLNKEFIFVSGGHSPDENEDQADSYTSVHFYSIAGDKWFKAPAMVKARFNHSSCVLGHVWLYVFGG